MSELLSSVQIAAAAAAAVGQKQILNALFQLSVHHKFVC